MKNKRILFALIAVLLIVFSNISYSVPVVENKVKVIAEVLSVESGEENGYKISKFRLKITDSEDVSGYTSFAKVGEVIEAVAYHKDSSIIKTILGIKEGDVIKGYLEYAGDERGGEWQISDVVIVQQTGCAKEGEYTLGPVSHEYAIQCCAGLEGFDTNANSDRVGAGVLCYNPNKGTPVCKAFGSRSEGWYYSETGQLLRYENCDTTTTKQGYLNAYWQCYGGNEADEGGVCRTAEEWKRLATEFCSRRCNGVVCAQDMKECSDGTSVSRTGPNCEFACPDSSTTVNAQVKCVFSGSTTEQKCYSADGNFACSGSGTCVTDVSGAKDTKITWKSSCGGYAYTILGNENEYAEFTCDDETIATGYVTSGTSTGGSGSKVNPTSKCGVNTFKVWNECGGDDNSDVPVSLDQKFGLKEGQRAIVKDYNAMKITYVSQSPRACVCPACPVTSTEPADSTTAGASNTDTSTTASNDCGECECKGGYSLMLEVEMPSSQDEPAYAYKTGGVAGGHEYNDLAMEVGATLIESATNEASDTASTGAVVASGSGGGNSGVAPGSTSASEARVMPVDAIATPTISRRRGVIITLNEGESQVLYNAKISLISFDDGVATMIVSKVSQEAKCGNRVCEAGEAEYCPPCSGSGGTACIMACRAGTCPDDCTEEKPVCGNGICEIDSGENSRTCPDDCAREKPVCGNGICESGESSYCTKDCDAAECSGCVGGTLCYPIATRAVIDGTPSYCDVTKEFKAQMELSSQCQNDYECKTNECSSGACTDLKKELEETRSLLNKVLEWLKRLF
ncbi:MAG: hypothetical protein Q8O03_07375 [Nanoarchaeota archaeon]|nr:hypothetical protein [Nanoarchaeota archaeon]